MSIELKIPDVGESIQEVQVGKWLKQEGDGVEQDEDVVELETDKASLELPAPAAGVLAEILKQEGETVSVGDVIGRIDETDGQPDTEGEEREQELEEEAPQGQEEEEKPQGQSAKAKREEAKEPPQAEERPSGIAATPSARRALREHGLSADDVEPSGERLRREDVERQAEQAVERDADATANAEGKQQAAKPMTAASKGVEAELEEAVPMSLIRRRIGARLVAAQQQAALLTTFNEIDMSAVVALRREYRGRFEREYGVDLGYMPFFVKATIDGLNHFPELNAEIREEQIVYRSYYHVGIAVGSEKGLVVPVLRFAERMSFAEIEEAIGDFTRRAEANDLAPDELTGGTFTITNGGVYGSLLSTPIVNPPQSGVLGMHAILDRPVARDGEVVIRPMMYIALTYDHRIVDGRQAVSFLKRVKDAVEEPARMLIEV